MRPWRALAAMLVAAGAAGCGTGPVREMAKVTAANTSTLKTRLEGFAGESRITAERRAALIMALDRRVSDETADLNSRLQSMQLAGQGDRLTLYNDLRTLATALAADEADAQARATALSDQIRSARAALAVPSDALARMAKRLGELAAERGFRDTVTFLYGFFGEVGKGIDDIARQQKTAAASAQDRTEKAASSVGGALDSARASVDKQASP